MDEAEGRQSHDVVPNNSSNAVRLVQKVCCCAGAGASGAKRMELNGDNLFVVMDNRKRTCQINSSVNSR